ncbi:MAG: HAMP domain-containing histidine kinase [Oscillospiraceae bacterium]|nr:HAMP domain-containing histidine kinase [Oscillospiraceae bacterium]
MDTKLKTDDGTERTEGRKLKRYNIIFKAAAFILIAASAFYAIKTLIAPENPFANQFYLNDLFSETHYEETRQYYWMFDGLVRNIDTVVNYGSEQNILAGNTVSQEDINLEIQMLYDNYLERIHRTEVDHTSYYFYDYETEYYMEYSEPYYSSGRPPWERFQAEQKDEIANIKAVAVQRHLTDFRAAVSAIENNKNIKYYIYTDGEILSTGDFNEIAGGKYAYACTSYANDQKTVVSQGAFAFDEKYIESQSSEFEAVKIYVTDCIIKCAVCAAVFLLALAYLVFAAGKKSKDPHGIHHVFIDKIYSEAIAALLVLSGFAVFYTGYALFDEWFYRKFTYALYGLSVLLAVSLLLVIARQVKSRALLKNTAVFILLRGICRFLSRFIFKPVKKLYEAGSPMVKTFVIIAVLGLLTAVPFAFVITLPPALIFAYRQIMKYAAVKNGVKSIKSGVYEKIEVKGSGEFALLAADINDISAGLGTEVERRLKSERLKTELIVNVSHDIKTPLTSIITYADLLKNEDVENEAARKYINVISSKAGRLKTLTDDLFDAAKASSGNIAVNFEDVDINALVTQGLGELDDKIKASSLDFKVSIPNKKLTARADGRLLWRVFENLLSNVFKYSLTGSRVYINVFGDERSVNIEVKNISAQELNIPEDEITERFKRGDSSRHSEGSGLGLDIAKSLMLCQNGELTIKIDGDLFKAALKIPKSTPKVG